MDAEEIKDNLDPLYKAAMKEQKDIAAGIEHLTKCTKDFIGKQYAEEINHLSADGYRALEDIISKHTTRLSIEIANALHHNLEE